MTKTQTKARAQPRTQTRSTPKMTWEKSPGELETLFASLVPAGPDFDRKKMFGYLCGFINGNLFAGLHKRDMLFRLPDEDQVVFLEIEGAVPFEPMPGRRMKGYVSLSHPLSQDPALLKKWMSQALAHVSTMPPKLKKPPKTRARNTSR